MEAGPSPKRRKTQSPDGHTQLSLADFYKPETTKEQVPIITDDASKEDVTKESSPELFSSPKEAPDSPHSSRTVSLSPISEESSDLDLPSYGGSPLSELCFGPSAYPILPSLLPSPSHIICFKPRLKQGAIPQPYPVTFKDVWDGNHVRMPCSAQSLYPVEPRGLVGRWDLIKQALSNRITNPVDFEKTVLSYNTHQAKKWSFKGLHAYFAQFCSVEESDTFFNSLLPKIISLALSLPTVVTHALPLLKKQENFSISLSQQQIACLLANAFLCTFPRRNSMKRGSEYAFYPFINFNALFSANRPGSISGDRENKLRCLFHYFTRVTSNMPQGVVTFQRQVLAEPPQWENSERLLTKLHVTAEGSIEDNGHGMLQVDFANKYLGGGVLNHGCVQEEIRFVVCPELLASLLFTEELDSNECLIMTGAERFSNYSGYADSFEWVSSHRDQTTRDTWGRVQTKIVAIDALRFYSIGAQFKPGAIKRELNKAYCGFLDRDFPSPCGQSMAVATGNWGCGAFRGNVSLKSVIQLMAAAQANRDVVYFTFGNKRLQQELSSLHHILTENNVTVGKLWCALVNYSSFRTRGDKPSLFSFLQTSLVTIAASSPQRPVSMTTEDLPTSSVKFN